MNRNKLSLLNSLVNYLKLVYDRLVFGFLFNMPSLSEISLDYQVKITRQKSINASWLWEMHTYRAVKVRHES